MTNPAPQPNPEPPKPETTSQSALTTPSESRVDIFLSGMKEWTDADIKELTTKLIRPAAQEDNNRLNAKFQQQLASMKKDTDSWKERAQGLADGDTMARLDSYDRSLEKVKARAMKGGVPEYVLRYIKDLDGVLDAEESFTQGRQSTTSNGNNEQDPIEATVASVLKRMGVQGKSAVDEPMLPTSLPGALPMSAQEYIRAVADGKTPYDPKKSDDILRGMGFQG